MKSTGLYDFFSAKCKEKGVKVERLHKLCDISRSTLYRYMKGLSPIPDETVDKLIALLALDATETAELREYIELSTYDATLIDARQTIDHYLFGTDPPPIRPIELVYYDGDRYLRTVSEVLDSLLQQERCGEITGCDVRMMNCVNRDILTPISTFLQAVSQRCDALHIEHLFSVVAGDYRQIAESLVNIISQIPLIANRKYRAFYTESDNTSGCGGLLDECIVLRLEYAENADPSYCLFSFPQSGMPSCLRFSDPYLYTVMLSGFEDKKSRYTPLVNQRVADILFDEYLLHYEQGEHMYLIKPNPCYDKIPVEQYLSLASRCSQEFFLALGRGNPGEWRHDVDLIIEQVTEYIRQRNALSYTIPNTDVYTTAGLLEFAETGRITDHISGMPPFEPAERRAILTYLRDRVQDKNDSYRMYITDRALTNGQTVIAVSKGYQVFFEFNTDSNKLEYMRNVSIANASLETIFLDYIENDLIRNHVLPQEMAMQFLNGLIDRLPAGKQAEN